MDVDAPPGFTAPGFAAPDAVMATAAESPPRTAAAPACTPPPPLPPSLLPVHAVGSRVMAQASFDQQYHAAQVVDRRGDHPQTAKYYVHYVDYNKRVDEWLPASKVEALAAAAGGDGGLVTRAGLTIQVPGYNPGGVGSKTCLASPMAGSHGGGGMLSPMASDGGLLSPMGSGGPGDRKLTRNLKRRYDEIHHIARPVDDLAPLDAHAEREHEEKTKVKNIQAIELGRHEMDTWYYAPYPEAYGQEHTLLMCGFCLKYMRKRKTLLAHKLRCCHRHPPGTEIYRHPVRTGCAALSMWEVDGKRAHVYCQNLCLLSKLFLDHKTLYYDVDPFLFYVLTERDEGGAHHLVGYFSKEKASSEEFNLACILTLPPYQRRGYGRFLIAFSYELSKREGKVGTPERPLSDLGAVSYRSYWTRAVLECLRDGKGAMSIRDISGRTAIKQEDVISTLQGLGLLKWWKGQHIIVATPRLIEEHLRVTVAISPQAAALDIDPSRLNWVPLGRQMQQGMLARPR